MNKHESESKGQDTARSSEAFAAENCKFQPKGIFFSVSLIIHGKVQGVWFRAETQKKARALGLTGWVKNRPDGTVEVFACGAEEELRKLLEWARTGPPLAKVSQIEETWKNSQNKHTDFEVI